MDTARPPLPSAGGRSWNAAPPCITATAAATKMAAPTAMLFSVCANLKCTTSKHEVKTPGRTVRALAVALTVLSSLVPPASGGMIDLVACAEVENVARIGVPSDHTFFLRLTCTTCRSEFPNAVGVSSSMVVEGIKGMRTPIRACPAPWRNSLARRQALAVTARLLQRARCRARFAANGRCAHRYMACDWGAGRQGLR
jgi:hypothetical protein